MDIRTTHVPGFKIGTAEDREGLTGVTVFLAPEDGAAAGLDVRGCAPGTRETDQKEPLRRQSGQPNHRLEIRFPVLPGIS